jgi:hypothetical protein
MNAQRIRKTLLLAAMTSMLLLGCELIVDFDRTKIPVEDAGSVDATPTETGTDAPADTGNGDGATDSGTDAADAADDVADAADSG